MKNRVLILPLAMISIVAFISCKTSSEKKNKLEETSFPKAELIENIDSLRDSSPVNILSASIEANIITLKISYSGGCERHEFKLYGSTFIMKSLPPQRGIMLWHNSNGDSCRELVEEEIKFDISIFAYEGGEIILNLNGLKEPISYTKSK